MEHATPTIRAPLAHVVVVALWDLLGSARLDVLARPILLFGCSSGVRMAVVFSRKRGSKPSFVYRSG